MLFLKVFIFDAATSKLSIFKKVTFPMVRNDEIHFSKVIIFDGATENGKMERIQFKVQEVLPIKISTNMILTHGSILIFSGFVRNSFA